MRSRARQRPDVMCSRRASAGGVTDAEGGPVVGVRLRRRSGCGELVAVTGDVRVNSSCESSRGSNGCPYRGRARQRPTCLSSRSALGHSPPLGSFFRPVSQAGRPPGSHVVLADGGNSVAFRVFRTRIGPDEAAAWSFDAICPLTAERARFGARRIDLCAVGFALSGGVATGLAAYVRSGEPAPGSRTVSLC